MACKTLVMNFISDNGLQQPCSRCGILEFTGMTMLADKFWDILARVFIGM